MRDFNCHHRAWGGRNIDKRGKDLYDLIEGLSLSICNEGSPTTMERKGRGASSMIDVTICSRILADRMSWFVSEEIVGSDHSPIICSLNIHTPDKIYKLPSTKWNTKKPNWDRYQEEIKKMISLTKTPTCMIGKCKYVLHSIEKPALEQNKVSKELVFIAGIWRDEECDRAIKIRKESYRKLRWECTYDNYIEFQKLNAETERFLKEKQKRKWKECLNCINEDINASQLWNMVKKFNSKNSTH